MKETENLSEWIERFQSNELDQQEQTRFLLLLENSPTLRMEVLLEKELNTILADENLRELSRKFNQVKNKTDDRRNKWLPVLIASSIIFLLTVGILTLVTKTGLVNHSKDQAVTGKSSGTTRNNYLSDNFITIPEFEILIGSTTRGPSFKLLLPQTRIIISRGTDLEFKWTNVEAQNIVKIELFNNKGKRIFESLPFPGNEFALSTVSFDPGVYYWKIIINEDLVSIGRIIFL